MMPLSAHILRVGHFPFSKGGLRGISGAHKLHLIQRGFTMLEILASIAIMAIAVLPLLGLIASTPAIHVKREHAVRAAFLAELRLEQVKGKLKAASDFGDFSTVDFNIGPDDPGYEGFNSPDSMFKYTVKHDTSDLDVDPDDPNDPNDIKTIIVTVWYDEDGSNGNGPNGTETSVTLSAKIARRR